MRSRVRYRYSQRMKRKIHFTWNSSFVWLMLYGVAVLLSSGRVSLASPAWLAPLFALRFIHTGPGTLRTRLTWLFFVLWAALSTTWYGATPLWGLSHFIFMALNAGLSLIPYLIYTLIRRYWGKMFVTTLAFPAAVVAVEWLTVLGSPFGTFGAAAYSQYGFLPLLQLLSVGGILVVSFLMAWTGAVADWALQASREGGRWLIPTAACALVLAALFLWGSLRISSGGTEETGVASEAAEEAEAISITGLTAAPVSIQELMPLATADTSVFRRRTGDIHRHYLEASEAATAEGIDLLVWPELAGLGTYADVAALTESAAALAARNGIYMVVPTMALDPAGERQALNRAVLIAPDGSIAAEHVKFGGNFMEGTVPGDKTVTVTDTPLGRIGLAICWDADFPRVMSQAGREEVDMLVVTARDWKGINPLHGRMSVFRGIENGTTVLRQADDGFSFISDPYGRMTDEGSGPMNAVHGRIRPASVSTLYPRIGDIMGPVSTVFLALSVAAAAIRGWRVSRSSKRTPPALLAADRSA